MPNHRPARARRKRVTAAQTAAVHINPRGTSRPEKMAAPRSRGATIVKLRENSAARAAVLALLVSVMLPALARLLRLLSRLLLSAALLLLSWFVLAAAALLLAALARAWGVLLLLVRIPLVWIIHQISPRGVYALATPRTSTFSREQRFAAKQQIWQDRVGDFALLSGRILPNSSAAGTYVPKRKIRTRHPANVIANLASTSFTRVCRRGRDRRAPGQPDRRAPLRPRRRTRCDSRPTSPR